MVKKIMKNYDIILRKCFKKIYWRINFGRIRKKGGKKL